MTYDYPKTKRLRKPDEFKTVFNKTAFKVHHTHLMAFVSHTNHPHARLGMAITKKKLPKAVARNRVKRLIKEQFRHLQANMPNMDIVLILKKSPKALSNEQLTREIAELLHKVRVKATHYEAMNQKK